MRAKEFITETTPDGKMHDHHAGASNGITRIRDVGGYDRVYHMNRLWMAMAMADGKSKKPVDMDSASWVEKYNTVHPYTEEEHMMLQQAIATIPSDSKVVVKFSPSVEPTDTNTKSIAVAFKGYPK